MGLKTAQGWWAGSVGVAPAKSARGPGPRARPRRHCHTATPAPLTPPLPHPSPLSHRHAPVGWRVLLKRKQHGPAQVAQVKVQRPRAVGQVGRRVLGQAEAEGPAAAVRAGFGIVQGHLEGGGGCGEGWVVRCGPRRACAATALAPPAHPVLGGRVRHVAPRDSQTSAAWKLGAGWGRRAWECGGQPRCHWPARCPPVARASPLPRALSLPHAHPLEWR